MAEFPAPKKRIAITHFIVSRDVKRSRRFYTDVLWVAHIGAATTNGAAGGRSF